MARTPLQVLFTVAEAYPFAKVGGLADVGAGLPKALARRGHDVSVLLPAYPSVGTGEVVRSLEVPLSPHVERVRVHDLGSRDGVSMFAVANDSYFDREQIYGYPDDDSRFILFSKAAVAFAAASSRVPEIIHANDWHLGLVPQYVRHGPHRSVLARTATVFTIHNLMYQGPADRHTPDLVGLDGFEGNLMARGIAFADAVNTVSRRYLKEILTPDQGMGLDGLLRSRRRSVRGILNGIDYDEFDPRIDSHIAMSYDASALERKLINKEALQRLSSLTLDPSAPVLGMVARLADQKGFDLLCACLDGAVALGAQVVVMGVGEARYRGALEEAAVRHPNRVAYHGTQEEAVARMVYAGSDLFLAPSSFEPCGLGPLIALRYGTIPVVRRTGGLAESIRDITRHPRSGLGFTFVAKYPDHLLATIRSALALYRQRKRWERLQRRAMNADFSWEHASLEYEQMYRDAVARRTAAAAPRREG